MQHLDFAAAQAGAALQVLKVLLEPAPLVDRAQLEQMRLQSTEKGADLFLWDELENTELVEFGCGVVDQVRRSHVAGSADLIADPRVDFTGDHRFGDLEELCRAIGENHGRDLVGEVPLQKEPLLLETGAIGFHVQT